VPRHVDGVRRRLQGVAEDDVADLVAGHTGTLEGAAGGAGAEVDG
jgi:hypothetical protein